MRNLKFIFAIFTLLFIATSCVENPQFKGISNFKIENINREKISFNVDVEAFNPNGYNLKVRKSNFNLYMNDQYVGKAFLLEKYKMKRKTTTLDNVPVEILLEPGIMMKLMKIAMGGTVKLRLEGTLKASAIGIPVKKELDQTRDFDLKDLNINFGQLLGF
ncbi:LEA type 2 family protein [Brumimicrobium mesophilum]|uniref:LEA type 2 family protein n=1 Tax=Brumimicrobium mesophilum TaxID=392717 RepID=UPI000D1408B1|nr:LEA type 2 family protein [Brumimicrobium mesophilum]